MVTSSNEKKIEYPAIKIFIWWLRMLANISLPVLEYMSSNNWRNSSITQSAGAVEYTDCTSAEEYNTPISILDMTLNNLMVSFQ